MTILGETVKAKREHQRVTLREAAKLAGVAHATISRVERGQDPDFRTFARLCKWLGLSPNLFIGDNGLK